LYLILAFLLVQYCYVYGLLGSLDGALERNQATDGLFCVLPLGLDARAPDQFASTPDLRAAAAYADVVMAISKQGSSDEGLMNRGILSGMP
jgi:hypothetical protein